jgi:hypothetical protein
MPDVRRLRSLHDERDPDRAVNGEREDHESSEAKVGHLVFWV